METLRPDKELTIKPEKDLSVESDNLPRPIILLPLKLEIRYITGDSDTLPNIAIFNNNTNETNKLRILSKSHSDFKKEQYWIRWYPDDIHIPIPIGKLTVEEKEKWSKYERKYDAMLREFERKGLKDEEQIREEVQQLIDIYFASIKRESSAETIKTLKENLVDKAIRITHPDELRDAKKKEMIELLKKPQNDENSFYIDFMEKLLDDVQFKNIRKEFVIKLVKDNSAEMVEDFGIVRARQLAKEMVLKKQNINWDFDTNVLDENSKEIVDPIQIFMEKGVKIETLPESLVLYTIKNGSYQKLTNIPINIKKDEISIHPDELNMSQWMNDFEKAVSLGMGIKITNKNKIRQIKHADWLIAVGFSTSEDVHSNLEEVFRRRNAAGQLSIVAQDSPTNNTETSTTPFTDLEDDIVQYFEKSLTSIPSRKSYNGSIFEMGTGLSDSHILTNYFKFAPHTLGWIEGSDLKEQNEATAINMLLWDACIHEFKWGWTQKLNNKLCNWNHLSTFFLENVRARGNFPAIRVGKIPYGILPVMSLNNWTPNQSIGENPNVINDIRRFCINLKKEFLSITQIEKKDPSIKQKFPSMKVPKPADEDNEEDSYESLLEMLRTTRVSQKLEVRLIDSDDFYNMNNNPLPIDCQSVKDEIDENVSPIPEGTYPDTAYLHHLSQMDIPLNFNRFKEFNPTDNPPVLKRLIYYLLEKVELKNRIVSDQFLQRSAKILKQIHPDKLKILLMEFLDLLSYRLDAWLTAIAYERLKKYNKSVLIDKTPFVGVYGWLEKPGDIQSTLNTSSEYIQAPSQAQAITAALLRNASLMGEDDDPTGKFRINLSSDQVRKGLWYLEGIRQNHLPEELLGYQIERFIHDNKEKILNLEELDIYKLRKIFPLTLQGTDERSAEDERIFVETVINGEDFLEEDLSINNDKLLKYYNNLNQGKINALKIVQDEIGKTQDAAADIAISEVLYQFIRGNTTRTSAWLDFLDGEILPPEPEFVHCQRTGDRHGTKVFLLVSPPDKINDIFDSTYDQVKNTELVRYPRKVAAPIVDHFCETILSDISTSKVNATISIPDKDDSTFSLEILLNELDFKAIDLIIGGEIELELKIRYYILKNWKENHFGKIHDSNYDKMGPFPLDLSVHEQMNAFSVKIILDSNLVKTGNLLRKLLHRNTKSNQISEKPSEELKIIDPGNFEFIDIFKSINILMKRAEIILQRLCYLCGYMNSIYEKDVISKIIVLDKLKALKASIIAEPYDGSQIPSLWNDLTSAIDEIILANNKIKSLFESELDPAEKLIDQIIKSDPIETKLDTLITILTTDLTSITIEGTPLDLNNLDLQSNLLEISRYGYKQALIPFPNSQKSLELFNEMLKNLLIFLYKRISSMIKQFKELTNTSVNQTETIPQGCPQDPWIQTFPWDNTHPAIQWLSNIKLEINGITNDWNEKLFIIKGKEIFGKLISILQVATDGKKLPIFTPYVLLDAPSATSTDASNNIKDWILNLDTISGPYLLKKDRIPSDSSLGLEASILQNYINVRPKIRDIIDLIGTNSNYKVYEDKYSRPLERIDNEEEIEEEEEGSNTDFIYISPFNRGLSKCFACLYVDDWMEFFPNMVETTGIAYRYDAPQTEAPNAILIAVPPKIEELETWTPQNPDLLAQTISETIDLIQLRMVGSDHVIGNPKLGKLFPALIFGPSNIGNGKDYFNALFPQIPIILCNFVLLAPFFIPASTFEDNLGGNTGG